VAVDVSPLGAAAAATAAAVERVASIAVYPVILVRVLVRVLALVLDLTLTLTLIFASLAPTHTPGSEGMGGQQKQGTQNKEQGERERERAQE